MNSVTKIFVITHVTVKGLEPAMSCVGDHDATAAPARHIREFISDLSDSMNSVKFLLI